MFSLNKKTLIIAGIVLVIIILIVGNVFLFLRWQARQNQAQLQAEREAKLQADIQTVQSLINDKKFDLLKAETLRGQGVDEIAVILAQKALQDEQARLAQIEAQKTPEEKSREKIVNIFENKNSLAADPVDFVSQIREMGDSAYSGLVILTADPNDFNRDMAYYVLAVLLKENAEKRSEYISVLEKGLIDKSMSIRVQMAVRLVNFGQKSGIETLINNLDNKNDLPIADPSGTIISDFVYKILKNSIDNPLDYNKEKWQQWWQINKDKIVWDQKSSKFILLK